VRTTLKRGIGQSAAADGDGRVALPPGTLSPIRRYRQPDDGRSGMRLVTRICLWLLAVIVMLVAAFGGGVYLFFHESVAAVQAHSQDVKSGEEHLEAPPPGKAANALVIGYDRRFGEVGYSRSDTLMLLRADPATKSISMLSFPRDLKVEVVCPGKSSFVDKINASYATCGAKGAISTIKALTGLPINYLITVDFKGFRQVVDRLGGVWVDVDRRYFNNNAGLGPGERYAKIDLKPGYQRLKGSQALDFVRYRHTDSDLFRNARQQEFVKAFKQQLSSGFSLDDIPKIVGAVSRNVEIGVGGGGAISPKTILSYAFFAYDLPPGHFFQSKIQNLSEVFGPEFFLVARESDIRRAVDDFVNPDVEAPDKAASVTLGKRLRGRLPPPRAISVTVLNGNGVQGSAALARGLLEERGYQTIVPRSPNAANAPRASYFQTTVYYDAGKKRARAGARRLANLFGDAVVVRGVPQTLRRLAKRAMTVVVVGKTFHGQLAPAPRDTTPRKQPPQVRRSPPAMLAMLRKAQRRVPFRLQLPTLIEASSEPDSEMPIHVYSIANHAAVRLVFRMPNGMDYWGVQQTSWDGAPALQRPSTTKVIGGRRFDFYFSGQHLHMVVLRAGGAAYWVVNSLGDALSNETMLAIAKGLRPLPVKAKRAAHTGKRSKRRQ
jgi:LCP family protein required for cell wall assembly